MSDKITIGEEIIDRYLQKLKDKEINKEQAVIELMNHEEISNSYDKQDIELIIDFEVSG